MSENNEIMTWEQAMAERAAEQARRKAALSSGPKYLSFKSGVLSVDKVAIPNNTLSVIALTFIKEQTYYPGRYDPNKSVPPICWAIYDSSEDLKPHDSCKEKQAEDCNSCDFFKWKSDPNGGKGKACKTRTRVAFIPAPSEDSTSLASSEIRFGTLPVTSGKDFDTFQSKCQALFGLPNFAVIAELKVVPDATSQFKVVLEPKEKVPTAFMPDIIKLLEKAEKEIWYEFTERDEDEVPVKASKKV